MDANIAQPNQNAAARSVAHFVGYALGKEHAARMRVKATDTKVIRVYALAHRYGQVAEGTLRVFWSAWRLAEAMSEFDLAAAVA